MWPRIVSLIGGIANQRNGMPTAWPGSTPSGAATPEKSVPTLPEIDAMATVAGLDQQMRNHRHAMAMGAAHQRAHYGAKFEEPHAVGITWNSPTINHPPSNGLARLGLGALAGGLGSLGVAAALGAFHVSPQNPATSVPDPQAQEWEITIQSVDGKPTVTSAEVVE